MARTVIVPRQQQLGYTYDPASDSYKTITRTLPPHDRTAVSSTTKPATQHSMVRPQTILAREQQRMTLHPHDSPMVNGRPQTMTQTPPRRERATFSITARSEVQQSTVRSTDSPAVERHHLQQQTYQMGGTMPAMQVQQMARTRVQAQPTMLRPATQHPVAMHRMQPGAQQQPGAMQQSVPRVQQQHVTTLQSPLSAQPARPSHQRQQQRPSNYMVDRQQPQSMVHEAQQPPPALGRTLPSGQVRATGVLRQQYATVQRPASPAVPTSRPVTLQREYAQHGLTGQLPGDDHVRR